MGKAKLYLLMANLYWRSALLKREDLRAKVAIGIEAPKVALSLSPKTSISKTIAIALVPAVVP